MRELDFAPRHLVRHVVVVLPGFARGSNETYATLEEALSLKSISDPKISPDGRLHRLSGADR